MALPAGYSSDEYSDNDDGFSLGGVEPSKKQFVYKEEVNGIFDGDKFMNAVISGQIEDVKNLVTGGVDINYRSSSYGNWTALMHAASQANSEMVKYLVENGADIREHHELFTPLLCLCDSKSRNDEAINICLDILVEYGADVNAVDWFKTNALVYAIKRGHEKLVLKLINLGCKLENSDSDGWTAIFYAVDGGYLQIVQILKDAGANIKRVDHRGRSLHDIALAKHYKEIAEIVSVSEKMVDIDEIIDNSKEYKRMSNYEYVLSELPSPNKSRFTGFHRGAVRWVYGIGMGSLVNLLLKKNVQLSELLTMDDNNLKNLGVMLSYDRKKMRYCIQKFHEHSWGRNALKIPEETEEIDLNGTAQLLCTVIQQVHICSSSTYFWKKNNSELTSKNIEQYIERGLYYIKYMQREKDTILNIIKEIEVQDRIIPSDLILPEKPRSYSKLKIVITVGVSICLLRAIKPSISPLLDNIKIIKWNM